MPTKGGSFGQYTDKVKRKISSLASTIIFLYRSKRSSILTVAFNNMRRRRDEFWLSGNDIEDEGYWEWAKLRTEVPSFGWSESPYSSHEVDLRDLFLFLA